MRTLIVATATVLAAMLIATPAAAQANDDVSRPAIDTSFHLALGAYGAAQGADLATTMYALGRGGYREANPLFAGLTDHPAVSGAAKMGVAAATSFLLLRVHEKHPRVAFWLSAVAAGAYSAIAIRNAQLVAR